MTVPGFQYCGGRYSTWRPLSQCHTPGWNGTVVTNSRCWIAGRAESGTGGSNSTTTGMATPTVVPSCRYSPVSVVLPGRPMVVNDAVTVLGVPSAPRPVTFAWYAVEYCNGASGTQELPSGRMAPLTAAPPAGVSVTVVTCPYTPDRPTSAETGTLAAPAAGLSVTANGLAGWAF